MSVYIEYVISDNMAMNFLLLYLTTKCTFCRCKTRRLLLSALLGTILAIILPLLSIPFAVEICIKLILSVSMVLIVNTNGKRFFLQLALFYILTFTFGGAIFGIFYLLGKPISNLKTFNYTAKIPVGVILLVPIFLLLLFEKIIANTKKNKRKFQNIYKCIITFEGKHFETNAYYDSGNTLVGNKNKPICIMCSAFFAKIKKMNIIEIGNINLFTVAGSSVCKLYEAEQLTIISDKGKTAIKNPLFALTKTYLFSGGAEILLHAEYEII